METSYARTAVHVYGYDLEPVGDFVTQIAFHPLLTDEGLESERGPILDELSQDAVAPIKNAQREHMRVMRGDAWARPLGGTIEDIRAATPESMRAFHARHYRLGNATLVIASAEPVEKQREYAEELLSDVKELGPDQPVAVEVPDFNAQGLNTSLQYVKVPEGYQTMVGINYELPETHTVYEGLSQTLIGMILNKSANQRLRREAELCYDAVAMIPRVADVHFRRARNWSHVRVGAQLGAKDAITGLGLLRDDVLHRPLPADIFEATLVSLRRSVKDAMESSPIDIANWAADTLAEGPRDEISLAEAADFADTISLDTLRRMHRDFMDTKPLVTAISNNKKVLKRIGEWAEQKVTS